MNFSKAVFENLISLFKKEQTFNFLFQADVKKSIDIGAKYSEVLNNSYKTVSAEQMAQILSEMPSVIPEGYMKEYKDCDHVSRRFWGLIDMCYPGLAVGWCTVTRTTDRHSLNVFIDNKGELYFIEPQNLNTTKKILIPYKEYRKYYKLRWVDVLVI